MAYSRFSRAAHLQALKKDFARKKAHLARAERVSEEGSGNFRRDLAAPRMRYWRDEIISLEMTIRKAEASRMARKAGSKRGSG